MCDTIRNETMGFPSPLFVERMGTVARAVARYIPLRGTRRQFSRVQSNGAQEQESSNTRDEKEMEPRGLEAGQIKLSTGVKQPK